MSLKHGQPKLTTMNTLFTISTRPRSFNLSISLSLFFFQPSFSFGNKSVALVFIVSSLIIICKPECLQLRLNQKKRSSHLKEIHLLKDANFGDTSYQEPFYNNYQPHVPIAIDLGTSTWRVGLTNSSEPNNIFPGLISRYRDRKALKTLTIVGNDVYSDSVLRSTIKTPFDGPLITNWDYIEFMLDYSFEHLGVTSDNGKLNNQLL